MSFGIGKHVTREGGTAKVLCYVDGMAIGWLRDVPDGDVIAMQWEPDGKATHDNWCLVETSTQYANIWDGCHHDTLEQAKAGAGSQLAGTLKLTLVDGKLTACEVVK